MASVKVVGGAVVVTSTMKLSDIEAVAKYNPKALVLMGGEDNKEEIFRVAVKRPDGNGSIKTYGVEFDAHTNDPHGYATVTYLFDGTPDKIKAEIAESIGGPLMNLNKIEASLPDVISSINKQRQAVLD